MVTAGMTCDCIPTGPFQANCWVLSTPARRALVVDPGGDAAAILALLDRRRLTVAGFLLTHGHVDHLGALAEVADRHPAPIGMHAADLAWAFGPANQVPSFYPAPRRPRAACQPLSDGLCVASDGLRYTVIATPGHSPGSVCFHCPADGCLVTGDTLFQGTVGRTDLPGGDGRALADSLRRLAALPPATRVYPGHGPATTLAEECRRNQFLKAALAMSSPA